MLADEFFLGTKLYHQKFSELCKPLIKYLGVTQAIYINIDKQGKAFSVFNDAKWSERFLAEHYYQSDPLMVHPDHIHNGFSFDNASDNQEFKDTLLYDATINFNWYHSFVYTEKNPSGGYFGFAFGTNKDNFQIVNRLVNEANVVKKLLRNLNKRLMTITLDLQENRMDFHALKGDIFYTQKGLVFHEEHENRDKIQLLSDLGFLAGSDYQNFSNKILLSPQEINCLRIYLTSHSIKTVARDLDLATTTVTSYIENIKSKLECNNKHELFEKAEILESLGRI